MKKILLIAPQYPYPPTDGGKISILNCIKDLSTQHEIYFAFFSDQNNFKKLNIKNVKLIHLGNTKKESLRFIIHCTLKLCFFKFSKYSLDHSKALYLKKLNITNIICYHSHCVNIFLEHHRMFKNHNLILRSCNIESYLYFKYIYTKYSKILSLILKKFLLKQELKYWNYSNIVLHISESDNIYCKKLGLTNHTFISDTIHKVKKEIVLRDNFEFYIPYNPKAWQNKKNLSKFISDIWIHLDNYDNVCLYITGINYNDFISSFKMKKSLLKNCNIICTGYLEDYDFFISDKILISPTFFGSGTRIKILEALRLNIPVLITDKDLYSIKAFNFLEKFSFSDLDTFITIYKNILINPTKFLTSQYLIRENICNELTYKNYLKTFNSYLV